jgi:Na+/H+ antiporter NhaC
MLKNILSKNETPIRFGLLVVFLLSFGYLLWWVSEGRELPGPWYSVMPALLAVGLAFATHNIYLSLGFAILLGGFLVPLGQNLPAFAYVGESLSISIQKASESLTDITNLQILTFAILILTMIAVIADAGGFRALAHGLSRYAKGKRSTKILTYIMGFFIFIDDYASTMIVGSSMRPLAKKYKISREKLAFLVDSTSAPIAGLAIVSTWIGYEVGLFDDVSRTLELGQSGYAMFFDAIAFRFYCILMLGFILLNIYFKIDFGPMRKAEERAEKYGSDYGHNDYAHNDDRNTEHSPGHQANPDENFDFTLEKKHPRARLLLAIIPFISMLLFFVYSTMGGWRRSR